MKISNKQLQEIEFLELWIQDKYKGYKSTQEEREEYLNITVLGKGKIDERRLDNKLLVARRLFDITVKMWREDMQKGLLAYWELLEDFNHHPFLVKVVDGLRKGLDVFPSYDGQLEHATLAWGNSKHALNLVNIIEDTFKIDNFNDKNLEEIKILIDKHFLDSKS